MEKSKLNILTAKDGDVTHEWDPTSTTEVNLAREAFARAKSEGYFAYAVKVVDGEPANEELKEFDPDAGKIVMTPQLVGG